jgi:phytoene dehydrogenase-like protein
MIFTLNSTIFKRAFYTLFALSFPLLTLIPSQGVQAKGDRYVDEQVMIVTAKPLDPRAQILKDYLDKHNSPLAAYAQDFIEAADMYDVDWRLVPAIAGTESTFGKRIPGGHDPLYTSYNAWGWGVYGTQALGFESWKDGIYTLNKGLREDYIARGLLTPQQMNKRYASSTAWGGHVAHFMHDIEQFALNHPANRPTSISNAAIQPQIAGESGRLAFVFN